MRQLMSQRLSPWRLIDITTTGFSMKQIHELLGLWQGHRSSREVRKVALSHVAELETKIREMEAMKRTLDTLASHCHGDDRPECPILDDLAHHEKQV
jgi:DNA-binding transcriptional MerR regulator